MALYVKLQNKRYEDEIDYRRFKSAIMFFSKLRDIIHFQENTLKSYLFIGDSSDDSYAKTDFDFGLLESYFRKEIGSLKNKSGYLGFAIEGTFTVEDKHFQFNYELQPRDLCLNREFFDIRLEVLPNYHAEIFEDVFSYKPEIKTVLLNRIKEYNKLAVSNQYSIKRVIMSKAGDEFGNLSDWEYFYTVEPNYFIFKVIDSSSELKDRLSFGNKEKFSNSILENDSFALLLSKYAQDYGVQVLAGSIAIVPKDEDAMKVFISKLASDLNYVASVLYKPEQETKRIIDEKLSELN